MKDFLRDKGVQQEWIAECVDTFSENSKYVGLATLYAGANRLLTLDHVLDEIPAASSNSVQPLASPMEAAGLHHTSANPSHLDDICFYITPIGGEDTIERRHSDLFLGSIVSPAVAECGLRLVRADQISQSGVITRQIIEHIVHAKLVVADLSFHNPNVFYELAIRHACRKPTVQIIQVCDKIPFDVSPVRTIVIDNTDIYSLIPQLESYKSEISNQIRKALESGAEADNPISVFFPGLKVTIPDRAK